MNDIGPLCFLLLTLGALVQISPGFLLTGDSSVKRTTCKQKGLVGEPLRQCVLHYGVNQLLSKRNDEWGWGERSEAEAIIALYLANGSLFSKKDPSTYISVKQMNLDLLTALSRDTTLGNENWGHGKVAHYIMGVIATCQNPRNFYGHNLVEKLKTHLIVNVQHFQSNNFALALSILALCIANAPVDTEFMRNISSPQYGIDDASLAYMAYTCVNDTTYSFHKKTVLDFILRNQDDKGVFGNEWSTALATQALYASGDKNMISKTDASLQFLIDAVDGQQEPTVALLMSALPAIAKTSYVDIKRVNCRKETAVTEPTTTTKPFQIKITVQNNLLTNHFKQTWTVLVQEGQTLLDVMIHLQINDDSFSLKTKQTTFGTMITAVCRMPALTSQHQYWQILDSGHPIQSALDAYLPIAGSTYTLELTSW